MFWARIQRSGRLLTAVSVIAIAAYGVLSPSIRAREAVPTPPGGGPGVNMLIEDQQNPTNLPAPKWELRDLSRIAGDLPSGARYPDLGGDDITVNVFSGAYDADLAVASNGDLFAILWYDVDDDGAYRFVVRRSEDSGTTWRDWAYFNPAVNQRYWYPVIHVAEGDVDRCFVAYTLDTGTGWPSEVHVAWSPLNLENGDFSHDTILSAGPDGISEVSLTTDAESFSAYYVYVAFSAEDGNGQDIHFVRSTDQGTTWEPSYVIGAISVSDRGYYSPEVVVGFGGYVHVVWCLGFPYGHEYDDALRYRRASAYAGGGLASWGGIQSLSSHTNSVDERTPRMGASLTSPDVMVACIRYDLNPGGDPFYDGIGTLSSSDGGASWSGMVTVGDYMVWLGDVLYQDVNDRWLIGLDEYSSWGVRWAATATPADWSELQIFSDDLYSSGEPEIVMDPSHADRIGILGGEAIDEDYAFLFDAEWRADPGYPNFAYGFPIDLAAQPVSDPAVVDLDGDGDLEIVFGDASGQIRVYRHDGTPLPGWPVVVGTMLSSSPVAIGDLENDGDLEIAAGTVDGRVYAYDEGGALLPGWPYSTPNVADTYVAIGALGGVYRRVVAVASGNWIGFVGPDGARVPGCITRTFTGRTITSAPAIGDIDGDYHSEVAMAASEMVLAFPMDDPGWDVYRHLEANVTGGIVLGDFDLDGDQEIVAPLANGVVHLMQGDGTEFPGAWPVTVDASQIAGAAIAQCLGTSEPEIAIAARNWLVTVLYYDGIVGVGWPTDTGGWYIYGKPIVGRVEGSSSDVVIGARGSRGWAWDNFAAVIPGWPKTFDDSIYRTPAYGDLDRDGYAEIVFLTANQLAVLDIGTVPSDAHRTWGMAGHDPQRTSCADCAEDVSAAEDAIAGVTRVMLEAPRPNPIGGRTAFTYTLPVRARVDLAIYDVGGRRLATVERAEMPAGRHEVAWGGVDKGGRAVASGSYIAELRVRGPGLDEVTRRKITIVR